MGMFLLWLFETTFFDMQTLNFLTTVKNHNST